VVITLLAVQGLEEHTDNAFRLELVRMCERLGLVPDWVTACMAFETAYSFDPAKRNPQSGATGLIQFCPWSYAHPEQWPSTDELAAMGAIEQLTWVEKYFAPMASKIHSLTDCYLGIFGGLGKGLDEAIYSAPGKRYDQNKALDKDGDGRITPREAAAPVSGIYQAAGGKLPIIVSDEPAPPGGSSPAEPMQASSGVAGALAIIFAGLWAWLKRKR
jgi:hypothetical protein